MGTPAAVAASSDIAASTTRSTTVRGVLLRLTLATLLPLAAGTALVAWQIWDAQEDATQTGLRDTAGAMSLAVDREIAVVHGQLRTLAASRLVDDQDWRGLHQYMQAMVANDSGAVIALVDPQGNRFLQSNLAYGSALPNLWELESKGERVEWQGHSLPLSSQGLTRDVLRSRAARVSGLYLSHVGHRPTVAVAVPVVRGGAARYALAYSFPPERLDGLLAATAPSAPRFLLVDGAGVIIAGSGGAGTAVGARIELPPLEHADAQRVQSRIEHGADGTALVSAYAFSEFTGWTVRASQNRVAMLAPTRRAALLWWMIFGLVVIASLIGAIVQSRRLALPLARLTDQASGVLDPARPTPRTGVRELDVLSDRLRQARDAEAGRRDEAARRAASEERQRAAEATAAAIRDREEHLRVALDAGEMGIWRFDLDDGKVRSDARHRALWDLPPDAETVDIALIRERMHPDDAGARWIDRDVLASGGPLTFHEEFRVRAPGGGWRWLAVYGSGMRDAAGRLVGMVGVNFDVTARREAEETLRESEERFRAMADGLALLVWVHDAQGRLEFVNATFCDFFGVTPEDMRDEKWQLLLHPEDGPAYVREWGECVRERRPFHAATRVRHADGTWRWIESWARPRWTGAGHFAGFVGTSADTTERTHAEEELHARTQQLGALLTSAPLGVAYFDREHRYVQINDVLADMNGMPAAAHLGRRMEELLPSLAPAVTRCIDEVFATGIAVGNVEAMGETPREPGVTRVWLNGFYPVRDRANRVVTVGCWATEITGLKQAEQVLRDADRRKDQFLATLAHELRNPLAPVRNAVRVLQRDDAPDSMKSAACEMIDRQTGHMVRLVDDLLEASRITTGKLELRREQCFIGSVIQLAVEAVWPQVERVGLQLAVALPPQRLQLSADPVRLVQVFANLLTNACKYTDSGGHIWLTVEREGDEAVVRIRDDGIGIAPDRLAYMFEMFSQDERALARSEGGLGIGLALSKGLVELHGGRIQARSDGVGHGSEFIVRLPLAVHVPTPAPGDEPVAHRPPMPSDLRVLVVDDNRDAADSLAALLRMEGCSVATAYDGPEALETAERLRPRLVLLDLGMPGMSGFDVCAALRSRYGDDPFLVALTGWGQDDDRRRSAQAGFDAHLVKPIDFDQLHALLTSEFGVLEARS